MDHVVGSRPFYTKCRNIRKTVDLGCKGAEDKDHCLVVPLLPTNDSRAAHAHMHPHMSPYF